MKLSQTPLSKILIDSAVHSTAQVSENLVEDYPTAFFPKNHFNVEIKYIPGDDQNKVVLGFTCMCFS